jgi:hypothetical protein
MPKSRLSFLKRLFILASRRRVVYTHATHCRSCAFAQTAVWLASQTLRLPHATVLKDCCYGTLRIWEFLNAKKPLKFP